MRAVTIGVAIGLVAGCLAGNAQAGGSAKRPMTFADLQAMKRVSDPQISPSGKWVMFSVTEVSLEKNTKVNHLWVVPLAGGKEVQQSLGTANEQNGRFSPDGKWVLYTSDADGSSQLWLVPWDESRGEMGSPRAELTKLSTGADGGIWSPDSKRVLFVSSVYPECSDQGDWAKEEACDKERDDAAAKDPVKAQLWTHLLYRHWNAYTGEKRSHVLVISLHECGGRTPGLGDDIRDLTPRSAVGDAETPTFSLGGPLGYAWAPDSKEIAYVANLDPVPAASTNNDVFTLRLDEAGARPTKVSTSLGSDDGPQYSPDGKWLAFRSQARAGYESDRFRLMVMDRNSKKTNEVELTMKDYSGRGRPKESDLDRWVDEFTWVDDSQHILFVAGDHGEAPIYETNITGDDLHRWGKALGEWSDVKELLVRGRMVVVGSLVRVDRPAEIVIGDPLAMDDSVRKFAVGFNKEGPAKETTLQTYEPMQLSHLNEALISQLELKPMQSYSFSGAGDTSVQGFLIRPPNFDPAKKYPVKFLIHGGPQGAWGDAWSYRWNPELFAADGYVVVMVNPRGSTGYGQAFIDGINGDWGGKAYVDLMKGLDAAEAKFPFIDKTRECALGGSYGGYMANWILTHTDRFKCIVTHDGMYNPESAYGTTEEMWFNEWEFRRPGDFPAGSKAGAPGQPWRYASGPAADDPFRKWSPMLAIQHAKTPTLVIHSQRDYRLDVSEGLQLFTALQRRGVPSEMLYFPDEGHWVLKPKNSELWYQTVNDWCDWWTGMGKYAGVGPEKVPAIPGDMAAAKRAGGQAAKAPKAPASQTHDQSDH